MPNFDATNLGQGATDSADPASAAAVKTTNTADATADVTAAATDLRTLINTLCPDGVEWKPLGDIFVMRNGYTPSKSEPSFWEGGTIPWFRMEDIRSNGNILADSIQHITPAAVKGKLFPAGSIILATTATIGIHALLTSDSLANQQFTFFTKRELPEYDIDMKFMFYYFFIVDEWCKKHIKVSSFPAVDVPALAKLKVPVPPLAVQAKIVQILDKFTELAKELAKEKQARRTQYEYYRDWLLDLAHPEGKQGKVWDLLRTLCPDGVEWKTVGEVADYEQPSKYIVKSTNYNDCFTTPVLTAGKTFILGRTNDTTGIYNATKDNPVILFDDFTGAIQWVDFPFKVKSGAAKMITGKKILTRYLYFYMANLNYTSDEHRRLWIGTYSNFRIPVPPLPVQAEIVRILDQFSTLAEDITAGLPAEIAARQTQYEYYRNQLLSFKER